MKRLLALATTCFAVTTILTNVHASSFPDVPDNYMYKEAVEYVKNENIAIGFGDKTYRPYNTMTRVELIKIIVASKYSEEEIKSCISTYGTNGKYTKFPDVVPGTEVYLKFADYICIAKEKQIVGGFSDGTMRPGNMVSVAESTKVISNTLGYTKESEITVDPNNKFKPYIDALSSKKALPVTMATQNSGMRRGEMAEVVFRLLTNNTSKSSVSYADLNTKLIVNDELGVSLVIPSNWNAEVLQEDPDSGTPSIRFANDKNQKFFALNAFVVGSGWCVTPNQQQSDIREDKVTVLNNPDAVLKRCYENGKLKGVSLVQEMFNLNRYRGIEFGKITNDIEMNDRDLEVYKSILESIKGTKG